MGYKGGMQSTHSRPIQQETSSALTARLYELRKQERALLVEFLATLAEVDRRRLFLELGFPSLFAFLTDHLGFTKSAAFRRTTAARILARFPAIAPYLADGRLCLTTLVELRDVLATERLIEILDRAAGRTEEQVRELVAALQPQPAPKDLLRRLPQPQRSTPTLELQVQLPAGADPAPSAALPPRPAPRIAPISDDLRVLRMTVGRAFVADLEAVRAALSHDIPDGNLEKVLHECVRRTLRCAFPAADRLGEPLCSRGDPRRGVAPRRGPLRVRQRGRPSLWVDVAG